MSDGLHPTVMMGEGRWQTVVRILRQHGTKESAAIADRIEGQVAETRRRWEERK